MLEAAAKALRGLLDAVGHSAELDEEIAEYISNSLEDLDPESCIDVLVELIASAVPSFSKCSAEKQTALVLQLLEQVNSAGSPQLPSPNKQDDLSTVLEAFKQATVQSQEAACTDITNTLASASTSSSALHYEVDVSGLIELCPPGVGTEFLVYLLQQQFRGNLQAAADYLFECPDIEQQQQLWLEDLEQAKQRQRDAELDKQQSKRQIVDRFDLQVVPELSRKPKYGVDILPTKSKQEHNKVRYRDGKVVSCKGEKYIVEKVGEEWDGGSRGKVYTKGKRGKGFM